MKTIAKSLRFALLMSLITIGMTALAQDIPNAEKMSIPTMMLIDQLEGRANFNEEPIKGAVPNSSPSGNPLNMTAHSPLLTRLTAKYSSEPLFSSAMNPA